jgi:hypothetical protein
MADSDEPVLESTGTDIPWGALSGLTTDGAYLYAVPDNAFSESRIFRIRMDGMSQGSAVIDSVTYLTDSDGERVKLDPEGIAFTETGCNGDSIPEMTMPGFCATTPRPRNG